MRLSDVPEDEIARLKRCEVANRSRARKHKAPVESVSIEGLILLQKGKCRKSGKPLIFDLGHPDRDGGKPVIAHEDCLTMKRTPGHVVGNVWLWRHDANQAEGRIEWSQISVGRRMEPKKDRPAKPKQTSRKLQSRGFQKPPPGHKTKWPTRKVGS